MRLHTQWQKHIIAQTPLHLHTCFHKKMPLFSQLVWLLLTEVPGHSVPEAETCRVLHRCGWSGPQCAWAPGHRQMQGGRAVRQKCTIEEWNNKGWLSVQVVWTEQYLDATFFCRNLSLLSAFVYLLLHLYLSLFPLALTFIHKYIVGRRVWVSLSCHKNVMVKRHTEACHFKYLYCYYYYWA